MHRSTPSLPALAPAGAFVALIALTTAAAGPAGASGTSLLDTGREDPRTAGNLPPAKAAPAAEPLRPSFETPGGGWWMRGEVPTGRPDAAGTLRDATAAAGARLPLVKSPGLDWELKPMVTGSPAAATRPGVSVAAPGLGVALGQTLALSLPFGLRLGTEADLGDRLGIGGAAAAAAPAGGAPVLAVRAGANLSTDLAVPGLESRVRVGLGIVATGPLPGIAGAPAAGAATAAGKPEPSECVVSFEIGTVGGAPLRVASRCPGSTGGGAPPLSIGFRTAF